MKVRALRQGIDGVRENMAVNPPCLTNLLRRQFDVREPNTVWITNITYIQTYEGWL